MRSRLLLALVSAAFGCASREEVPLLTVTQEKFVRLLEVEGFLRASTSTPVAAPFSPSRAVFQEPVP